LDEADASMPARDRFYVIGIAALAAIGLVGFILVIDYFAAGPDGKARALCDEQVAALLQSKDLVEVTRAGIIINRLECSMRRRL
jgi:hypothetical protein